MSLSYPKVLPIQYKLLTIYAGLISQQTQQIKPQKYNPNGPIYYLQLESPKLTTNKICIRSINL